LTMGDEVTSLLDPAVGSGTFLFRAHDRLRRKSHLAHKSVLDILWGFDISSFPAELAVINLCRQDLSSQANYPRIGVRDFFYLKPGDTIDLPLPKSAAGTTGLLPTELPQFDAVVGNPPFVRSQHLDDLDSKYKAHLSKIAADAGVLRNAKFDAFAYFILHAEKFLKPGGRLGLVTSAAWLTTEYGAILQRYLLEKLHLTHLVFSTAEPFFPYQKINTIILVAEKPMDINAIKNPVTFLTFSRSLADLFGASERTDYWVDLDSSLDAMLSSMDGVYDHYSIRRVDSANALAELTREPTKPLNWARPFRTSDIYEELFK
jgi:type I restriction-modification system DNA methylase subunit